jgi:hypothetical protein
VITIVQSTAIVAGSGIAAITLQVQGGSPSTDNIVVQQSGIENSNIIDQFGGITSTNEILQFTGANQDAHIINPSQFETTAGVKFVIFPRNFSRNSFLRGVVGTSGTVEEFFDHSPFFFTPSETDPNTLRDISEAEQFLIFSQTTIATFDPFRNTPRSTFIVTDRGEEGSEAAEKTNVITNGSFEQGLSGWTVSGTGGSNTITTVTSQPTGVGFSDSNPVTPINSSRMAYISARQPSPAMVLKQEFNFGTKRVNSSQLDTFGFFLCPDVVDTNRQFQANLIFVLGTEQKANIRYRVSGMSVPEQPSGVTEIPIVSKTLIGLQSNIFNSVSRNIKADLDYSTFEFDQIQTWFIFDDVPLASDFLLDAVIFTVNLPQEQLLKTAEIGHVNTAHPIGTGQLGLDAVPLTISGADNITQVDLSPPFFAELNPGSGTRNVPETTDLEFHIQDTSSALDQGTIQIFMGALQIVTAGVPITGVEFPIASKTVLAPNDIEYIFQPSAGTLAPGDTITVSGSFADFAAVSNLGEGRYDFTIVGSGSLGATISGGPDLIPPVITPTEPTSSATEVSANTNILFRLTDDAAGVDPSTVKLLLNGATKIQNDVASDGIFSRVSNTSNGFDYTYNPAGQFTFGETVTGTIQADDFSGNSALLSYDFLVTSSDSLAIENFFLGLDQSVLVTTGTVASVCVTDEIFGVASGTTTLTINGVVPSGLVTTFSGTAISGTGPTKMFFEVPIEPLVNYRNDLVFFVHAENEFPGSFPVIREQQFTLRPGYDVRWLNKLEAAEGGPETVFPYLTNIEVLTDVNNFAKTFGESSAFFTFLVESQASASLGATIVSNIKTADLPAIVESLNPFFEYGKTMTLELFATDLAGNKFSLTHTFVIESAPA